MRVLQRIVKPVVPLKVSVSALCATVWMLILGGIALGIGSGISCCITSACFSKCMPASCEDQQRVPLVPVVQEPTGKCTIRILETEYHEETRSKKWINLSVEQDGVKVELMGVLETQGIGGYTLDIYDKGDLNQPPVCTLQFANSRQNVAQVIAAPQQAAAQVPAQAGAARLAAQAPRQVLQPGAE